MTLARKAWLSLIGATLLVATTVSAQTLSVSDSFVITLGEGVPRRIASERDVHKVPTVLVATARSFNCLLPLTVRVNSTPARTQLIIEGIADVGACPSAMGPAQGWIDLPDRDGVDTLEIISGSRVDRYLFRVTDSLLTVAPIRTAFTRFTAAARQRAPVNSFAFYCDITSTDSERDARRKHICDDFVQILVDSLGGREFFFGPDGELPYPERGDLTRADMRYFRYRRPEDFGVAYDLLQRFSRSVMAGLTPNAWIELVNWRGSMITSYRCQAWQGCESLPPRPRW